MANPGSSQDVFGIGNLIDQFKGRAREVIRQANVGARQAVRDGLRQMDRGLDPIHEPLQAANRALKETQAKVQQHQRELPERLKKAAGELGAELGRKDAAQRFRDSDGTTVMKPVLDAAGAVYRTTPVYKAQDLYEQGKKEASKNIGEGIKHFADEHHGQIEQAQKFIHEKQKEGAEHFREGLRQAYPTLDAIDRSLPFKESLQQTSQAINDEKRVMHQQIHHALWDPCPDWMQSIHDYSKGKADHLQYYADATGVKTVAEDVQDFDTVHSVGKGAHGAFTLLKDAEGRKAVLNLIKQPEAAWKEAVALRHAEEAEKAMPHAPGSGGGGRADLDRWHIERLQRLSEDADKAAFVESRLRAMETANKLMEGANAGGRKNCIQCCMATYDRMHGVAPTVALPRPLADVVHEVHGVEDCANRYLQTEGSSGWLSCKRADGSIHEVHAAKVNGQLVLSERASGGRVLSPREMEGLSEYKFKPEGQKLNIESTPTQGDRALLESYFNRQFEKVGSLREAEAKYLTEAGSSGVLWYHEPPPGKFTHVINVANVDGHVLLMDSQSKRLLLPEEVEKAGYNYRFLETRPPVGYEGIPPHGHMPSGPTVRAGEAPRSGARPMESPAGHEGLPPEGRAPHVPGPPEPPRPFGMRPQDEEVFAEAARHQGRWIVVRETNPEALKYIGEPGYTPKPFDCKAKSANLPWHEYAGLVVNPAKHPEAFRDPVAAAEEWNKMMKHPPEGFVEDAQGRLRIRGELVHSDYDVYDVIDPNRPRGNLSLVNKQGGQPYFETHGLPPIKDYVNERVGSPVIQHPGEAQLKGHSEQRLIVFGPNGERFVTDGKQAIEDVYNQRFQGRAALDHSQPFDPHKTPGGPTGPIGVVGGTEYRGRAPEPEPPAPGAGMIGHDSLREPLSRDELWRQGVENRRGFESSPSNRPGDAARPGLDDSLRKQPATVEVDPHGVGPRVGKGDETFAAVQVLDKDGRRVDVAAGHSTAAVRRAWGGAVDCRAGEARTGAGGWRQDHGGGEGARRLSILQAGDERTRARAAFARGNGCITRSSGRSWYCITSRSLIRPAAGSSGPRHSYAGGTRSAAFSPGTIHHDCGGLRPHRADWSLGTR